MDHGTLLAGTRRTARRAVIAVGGTVLAAAVALLVMGAGGKAPDHGPVVAQLPIPFRAAADGHRADVIRVRVGVGQRFAIRVDAVDYYAFWRETGAVLDPRVVEMLGEFPDGSCPAQVAGCAVPSLYGFVARGRGTTTMTWQYRQGYRSRPSAALVAVDITVR